MARMNDKNEEDLRFPDLKAIFLRGLLKHEKWQRSQHYLKSAAECTSRAIVSLDLCLTAIKSVKQAQALPGIGAETVKVLKRIIVDPKFLRDDNNSRGFPSSASALLVTLLDLTEETKDGPENTFIPETVLREKAKDICEEQFLDVDQPGFCPAWWRLEVLIARGFIKRRSRNKQHVYELLAPGRCLAQQIKGLKTPNIDTKKEEDVTMNNNNADALYTNDNQDHPDALVLLVDDREWGGDTIGLGKLCEMLEEAGVKYRTDHLRCGDYQFVWRCQGREITLPLLIERKRADDLANSLKDGRFWSQINRMIEWKQSFTEKGFLGSLHYVIEGCAEKYVVQCTDGCQGVGRCGNPSLQVVQGAIKDLESHEELSIHKTASVFQTVCLLAVMSADLATRIFMGEFEELKESPVSTAEANSETEKDSTGGDQKGVTTDESPLTVCLDDSAEDKLGNSNVEPGGSDTPVTSGKSPPTIVLGDSEDEIILLDDDFSDLEKPDHALDSQKNNNFSEVTVNCDLPNSLKSKGLNSNIDSSKNKKKELVGRKNTRNLVNSQTIAEGNNSSNFSTDSGNASENDVVIKNESKLNNLDHVSDSLMDTSCRRSIVDNSDSAVVEDSNHDESHENTSPGKQSLKLNLKRLQSDLWTVRSTSPVSGKVYLMRNVRKRKGRHKTSESPLATDDTELLVTPKKSKKSQNEHEEWPDDSVDEGENNELADDSLPDITRGTFYAESDLCNSLDIPPHLVKMETSHVENPSGDGEIPDESDWNPSGAGLCSSVQSLPGYLPESSKKKKSVHSSSLLISSNLPSTGKCSELNNTKSKDSPDFLIPNPGNTDQMWKEKVDLVLSFLPDCDRNKVVAHLVSADGNVQQTINSLLESQSLPAPGSSRDVFN